MEYKDMLVLAVRCSGANGRAFKQLHYVSICKDEKEVYEAHLNLSKQAVDIKWLVFCFQEECVGMKRQQPFTTHIFHFCVKAVALC